MSREALARGANHDFVNIYMRRQGEQPGNAIGNGLGFDQLAELANRFTKVFLVITSHILEFTDHDARHDQGNADTKGADLASKRFSEGTDSKFTGTIEAAEWGNIPSHR